MDRQKFRELAEKCCETIKELINADYPATWQSKAEILEECSEECDGHNAMEEFLNWGEQFLPK